MKPNFLVILIDDLRYDEFGAGGHPYLKTPHIDRQGKLDNTFIIFLSDNGYFFGEHGLGPERRFAYEEGIRSPFAVRFPPRVKSGRRVRDLVICQDIAPTLIELAGGTPGAQIQGRSLLPLLAGQRAGWRKSLSYPMQPRGSSCGASSAGCGRGRGALNKRIPQWRGPKLQCIIFFKL
jgi:arylsulfatase A-like enzyme